MSEQIQVRYRQEGNQTIVDIDESEERELEAIDAMSEAKELETNHASPAVTRVVLALKDLLGKGLYPNAEPQVEAILTELEQEAIQFGFEQAQYSVGDWNRP